MINKLTIVLLAFSAFSLTGCFSSEKKQTTDQSKLGAKNIKYYSNKTVTSLEIPPDLTKPSSQNSFRLSEYVSNVEEDVVDFSGKKTGKQDSQILTTPTNIEVKKLGQTRWLVVDKKPESVWNLVRNFFKSHGFAIKKTNKAIGIMETDFLENRPDIPEQSLGLIRSMLKKAIAARYALPTLDKYKIRIEPVDGGNKTEVYLVLNSVEEVVTKESDDSENTIWQVRAKDQSLEAEMLYRLMIYLGGSHAAAREKIISNQAQKKLKVEVVKGVGGYAKLKFLLGQYDTWENIGWALDQLDINVEDRDVKEGSFYINVAKTEDKGILSRLFGDDAIKKSFQILVKQISTDKTEVYFNDLSEKNDQATIDFSYKFLADVAKQFE
ncbi:Outer membrane protein NlpB, lipoprotein component of the protein assembly complex (forms a complex with YaeT, YfiO, and YfgL); Lipoprotein-34 precursor [uncultured Candidatus Thioglobus sp.]|nr:Outer membrane protein NlpB, lipoprotein component of the protein assembly complex (forms a complex with YaeT, YfiO, and YfgL); Lipoprotein-34 precursor [uncultured Candidatus Thioglobus sp.]